MQNYLNQLIADMRQAAKDLPAKPYYDIPPEAEGIEYVVEWENAESKPMQEWFGIAKENFPPAEKLTDDQLKLMVNEILDLWEAYHFYPNMPENLPNKIAYSALVGFMDKSIAWVSEGESMVELCDLDPENCPFTKEYCWCKDLDDDEMGIYKENGAEIALLDKEIGEIEAKGENDFLPEHKLDHYVEQLLKDILAATVRFLGPKIVPLDAEDRGIEDTRQLGENPFLSLFELTGIDYHVFPDHIEMDGLQTRKVLRAMLCLLDACKLKIDFPPGAPHEIKYEALRDAWDYAEVQHLPISGMDFDLCTGDNKTCPYGDYCDCRYSLSFDIDDVPPEFQKLVKSIAENTQKGAICFLNPDTLEIETLLPQFIGNPEAFEMESGKKWEETFRYESWENRISFEPISPGELNNIMADYTEFETNDDVRPKLLDALNKDEPEMSFEKTLQKSDYYQHWLDFKNRMIIQLVWLELKAYV